MTDHTAISCQQRRGPGRPFAKGFDSRRNLNGRPRESRSLSDELRRIWDQPASEAKPIFEALGYKDFPDDPDLSVGEVLAYRLVGDAFSGRIESFKQIFDRLDPITKKEEHVHQTVDARASLLSVLSLIEERKPKKGMRIALAMDYAAQDRGEKTIDEDGFVPEKQNTPLALTVSPDDSEPAPPPKGEPA